MVSVLPLVVGLALAAAPPLVEAEGVPAGKEAPERVPFLGVEVDVGLPSGAAASLVATPHRFVRVEFGGVTNGVGSGVRFGAALVAFPSWVFRPVLGAEAGYAWGGAGAWLPSLLERSQVPAEAVALVRGTDLSWGGAQVGFELGSKHVALTVRVGVSYVRARLPSQVLEEGDTAVVSASGLALRGFIPSARLGLLVCFG